MKVPDPPIRTAPLWVVSVVSWLVLPVTVLPAVFAATDGGTTTALTGVQVLCWGLYLAGLLALALPRPWGLVVLRLGGVLVFEGAVVAAFAAGGLRGVVAVAAAAVNVALTLTPSLGDRQVDGASYPGERRFAFRAPREAIGGIAIAVALPAACFGAVLAAITVTGGLRWLWVVVAVVLAAGSWFLVRQLGLLAHRWFVFAPRAIALHDPYVLADTISIPYARVFDVALASEEPELDDLLDLRAGATGPWVQLVVDHPFEVPPGRPVPERFRRTLPRQAIGIAWPVTLAAECVETAAAIGLPTH